ncbi:MAG: BatD family protein [Halioglobus sp.]
MIRALIWYSLTLLLALPLQAADELDTLLQEGKLTIASELAGQGMLVPGQRAQLILEIATSTWFTSGTRIRIPEVPGLVILQTEQFASNASESRAGQTWVVQRWSLDVYPQRPGSFTLPPIALSIEVSAGDQGNVRGQAFSPALDFTVDLPPALEQAGFWVAAPRFSVEQRLDKRTDQLRPGDAFERRIEFIADDVQAMMLPEVSVERQAGLAAYPAPALLENSNNRGQASGSRVQIISYVAEQSGSYLLPGQDFFWWDTSAEELRVLSIEPVEVLVTGDAISKADSNRDSLNRRETLTLILAALVIALLFWLLQRYRPWQALPLVLAPAQTLWGRLQKLRKPALAQKLNPDSSAGD